MAIASGSRLGPYSILHPIGRGGMGEVYRARDERLGRDVAIKVLPEEVRASSAALARFQREARAVAALSHPNVVNLFDIGKHGDAAYAVMELLEGATLRERLAAGPLDLERTIAWARALASGLGAAHAKGIVHRDVKPENIFVTVDGHVKILDFGLARSDTQRPFDPSMSTESRLTSPGTVVGTLSYMSPEQVEGGEIDARSDIFSFGCVLYEMLAGRRPFSGESVVRVMSAIVRDDPAPIARVLPDRLQALLRRCLEKEPAQRCGSAEEIVRELDAIARESATPTSEIAPAATRAGRRLRPAAIVASVVLLAITLAIGVAAFWSRKPDPLRPTDPAEAAVLTVAVLPFVNLGGNPADEYLSDGVTEELINALGHVRGLRVPGRTSSFQFKGRNDLDEVASKLRVQHAIEGSVQRSGDRLRIRAQLVTIPAGVQVWSQSYDETMSDLLAVQHRIAQSIVTSLGGDRIGRLGGASVIDPEAHRLYLRARHFADRWTRETFDQALISYKAALDRDSSYAAPYAGLADLYSFMDHRPGLNDDHPAVNYARGEMFAQKALELDPESAEAHTALGHIYIHKGTFAEAESHLARAVRINPNSAIAHLWYSMLLNLHGRVELAAAERQRGVELDPLSLHVNRIAMSGAWVAGDFEHGIAIGEAAAAVLPDATEILGVLARAYAYAGRFEDAERVLEQAESSPSASRTLPAFRAILHALAGQRDAAKAILVELENDPDRHPGAVTLWNAWAATGDAERAFHWMEQAISDSPDYARASIVLPPHPAHRALREDPRYSDARKRLKLPEIP